MAPRSQRSRVLVVVLSVLGVLGLGVVAVGTIAYCSLGGCTLFSEDFEPDGDEATQGRAAAGAEATGLADALVAGREVLAQASVDGCRTGQNNWKIKDTYSHECSVVVSRVVVVDRDGGFDAVGEGLTATDALVRSHGCAPEHGRDLDEVRAEYWTPDNPQVGREGAAGIPGAGYACPDLPDVEPGSVDVAVDPTSSGSTAPYSVAFGVTWLDETLSGAWYTTEDVASLTTDDVDLAMVVTVRVGYYDTEF